MNDRFLSGALNPLHDARRRLEAVLANASVAIFLMDDRQHCIFMNKAAEELTGFTFEEVLNLDRPLHDIIHHTYPDGRPFPLHECAIDRAFPEHNKTKGEEIFVHRDGSFYPVSFTASPIRDEESLTVGTIIEVRNISEEKLAEERQRLLLNELNHRVKNTLATVQSLAWQTFRPLDPDAVDRFNGRLTALSRAHNILTESSWQSASVAEIIDTAVEVFGRDRFVLEGPACGLDPKAAVSLSMVIHELGTNAIKYGSLGAPAGSVSISWSCDLADNGDLLVELEWLERGGPPVTVPTKTGFGLRLIQRQLALEFGGKVDLDFRPEGLRCALSMQVPPHAEPFDSNKSVSSDR